MERMTEDTANRRFEWLSISLFYHMSYGCWYITGYICYKPVYLEGKQNKAM